MSDMSLTFRVQAEAAAAMAELRGLSGEFQKLGTNAKAAMREAAQGGGLANNFEMLRASIDPAFAATKRYQQVQSELAGMVARGEASQSAANIVLEQAAARFMGVATAAERAASAERDATAATQAVAREAAELSARFTGLRASVDPAYAATLRFSQAQDLAANAVRAGAVSQREADATLTQLAQKLGLAEGAAGRFAAAQTQAVASAHSNAALTGNVAAQFNDIGVMLAAGQNPFQLAIQQGTQLSQALNQVGGGARGALAALRAGFMSLLSPTTLLTVAIIAGGAALFQWFTSAGETADKAEELKKQFDELGQAISAASSATDAAAVPMDKLVQKYGALAQAVREARIQLADKAFEDAKGKLDAIVGATNFGAIVPLADLLGLKDFDAQVDLVRQKMAAARAEADANGTFYDDTADQNALAAMIQRAQDAAFYVGAIRDEFGITQQSAQDLAQALAQVAEAPTAAAQVTAAQTLKDKLAEVFGSLTAADAATQGLVTALSELIVKGGDLDVVRKALASIPGKLSISIGLSKSLSASLQDAWDAASGIATANIAGPINAALGPAAALAARLWDAAEAQAAGRIAGEKVQRIPGGVDAIASGDIQIRDGGFRRPVIIPTSGSSAGSGGGSGTARDSLAGLSAEAQKTLDALDIALGAINEKVKAGLMGSAEAGDAIASAKDKANNDLASLIAQIDRLGPAGQKAAAELRTHLGGATEGMSKAVQDLSKSMAESFASPFEDFIKGAKSASEVMESLGDTIISQLAKVAAQQAVTGIFEPLLGGLFGGSGNWLSAIFGGITGHATGGEIDGVGTGTSDSNLRRLSKGEFVVNADATAKNKPLLQAINAGKDVQPKPAQSNPAMAAMSRLFEAPKTPRADLPQFVSPVPALFRQLNAEASAPRMSGRAAAAAEGQGVSGPDGGGGWRGGRIPVSVTVNNMPAEHGIKSADATMGPGGINLDMVVEQIEDKMNQNLRAGRGISTGLEGTYGLKRSTR